MIPAWLRPLTLEQTRPRWRDEPSSCEGPGDHSFRPSSRVVEAKSVLLDAVVHHACPPSIAPAAPWSRGIGLVISNRLDI